MVAMRPVCGMMVCATGFNIVVAAASCKTKGHFTDGQDYAAV